eukprot:TRINITY_DN1442_c0_g2_i1.p1 TRINITY_DN1442_c0_g2~~TRINITY_DN1442_c0_g2_i1.p1  ORF type:complete len:537 (+),score=64.03 TRINITY_DN1442_c0_g2_i1:690-2300(+)
MWTTFAIPGTQTANREMFQLSRSCISANIGQMANSESAVQASRLSQALGANSLCTPNNLKEGFLFSESWPRSHGTFRQVVSNRLSTTRFGLGKCNSKSNHELHMQKQNQGRLSYPSLWASPWASQFPEKENHARSKKQANKRATIALSTNGVQAGGLSLAEAENTSAIQEANGSFTLTPSDMDSMAAFDDDLQFSEMYGWPGCEISEAEGLACDILDRPGKKQVVLFHCNETEELARRIASDRDTVELRSIQWGQFLDGFPNLFVPSANNVRGRHVAFLASFSSPAVIFEQLSIIYALPRMFVSSFTLVLPFFPTGTQERMEDEGDIATAFTLSRILSNIPLSRGGPTSLVIFDIHALQERFYFGDNVLPCFESGVPILKNRLHQLSDGDKISIAFPDEGAWKRFHRQFQHYPTIICTKVRDGDERIVRLKEGDPMGRHVIIVDDLVQTGSTVMECQKLLKKLGAEKVSAYATHGVFPQRSWERFATSSEDKEDSNEGFAHFWITDSCPKTAVEVRGVAPFEVLTLAPSIQAALQV